MMGAGARAGAIVRAWPLHPIAPPSSWPSSSHSASADASCASESRPRGERRRPRKPSPCSWRGRSASPARGPAARRPGDGGDGAPPTRRREVPTASRRHGKPARARRRASSAPSEPPSGPSTPRRWRPTQPWSIGRSLWQGEEEVAASPAETGIVGRGESRRRRPSTSRRRRQPNWSVSRASDRPWHGASSRTARNVVRSGHWRGYSACAAWGLSWCASSPGA